MKFHYPFQSNLQVSVILSRNNPWKTLFTKLLTGLTMFPSSSGVVEDIDEVYEYAREALMLQHEECKDADGERVLRVRKPKG